MRFILLRVPLHIEVINATIINSRKIPATRKQSRAAKYRRFVDLARPSPVFVCNRVAAN